MDWSNAGHFSLMMFGRYLAINLNHDFDVIWFSCHVVWDIGLGSHLDNST